MGQENLFCPSCSRLIENNYYWRCSFCNTMNGLKAVKGLFIVKKGKSFYEPCRKCGKLSEKGQCPFCDHVFTVNKGGDPRGAMYISTGLFSELGKIAMELPGAVNELNKHIEEKARQRGEEPPDFSLDDLRDFVGMITGKVDSHEWEMKKLKQKKEKIELEQQIEALKPAPAVVEDPRSAKEKKQQEILEDIESAFLFERKKDELLENTKKRLGDEAFAKYGSDPQRLEQELKRIDSIYMLLKFKGYK